MTATNKINIETFIRKLAEKYSISIAEARSMTTKVFDMLDDVLILGDSCTFNIGTFKITDVKEKTTTINFGERKGEIRVVPAHKKVSFIPSKKLKFAFRDAKSNN